MNAYNNGIRNRVLYREEELSTGDILMITKNNYFWVEGFENLDFLANGEFVEVMRVKGEEVMYGFRFCNVLLYHRDYDIEFEAKIIMDVLHTEVPGLTRAQNDLLFANVMEDYADISQKRLRYKKSKREPLFQCVTGKIRLCRYLSQGAGRGVEECISRFGLHTTKPIWVKTSIAGFIPPSPAVRRDSGW